MLGFCGRFFIENVDNDINNNSLFIEGYTVYNTNHPWGPHEMQWNEINKQFTNIQTNTHIWV